MFIPPRLNRRRIRNRRTTEKRIKKTKTKRMTRKSPPRTTTTRNRKTTLTTNRPTEETIQTAMTPEMTRPPLKTTKQPDPSRMKDPAALLRRTQLRRTSHIFTSDRGTHIPLLNTQPPLSYILHVSDCHIRRTARPPFPSLSEIPDRPYFPSPWPRRLSPARQAQ